MTRVETTIGLFCLLFVIAITAWVGLKEGMFEGEEGRLAHAATGFQMRSVESGAQMFDQYCATCHNFNAGGLKGPPLNELSGLHGGDLGEGVAWRLEELNWDRSDPYGYVYSTISAGKLVATRPEKGWIGDGKEDQMAMPAWSQKFGGPLRDDQIKDLASYVVNFRSYLPDAGEENAYGLACTQVLESISVTRATYTSKCYQKLCQDRFDEDGRTVPPPPESPDTTEGPEFDAYQVTLARYWEDFFDDCEALGGQAPPLAPTATLAATTAVTGTLASGTAAPVGTPGTALAATGTVEAPEGTGTPAAFPTLLGTPAVAPRAETVSPPRTPTRTP